MVPLDRDGNGVPGDEAETESNALMLLFRPKPYE